MHRLVDETSVAARAGASGYGLNEATAGASKRSARTLTHDRLRRRRRRSRSEQVKMHRLVRVSIMGGTS